MSTTEDFHELFPPEDDDKRAPEVTLIHVTRFEGGGPAVYCSRSFQPEELPTLAELFEQFGGGHYELIARNAKKQISARRRYKLGGAPKSLNPAPETADVAPVVAPPPVAASAGGGMSEAFMMMVLEMMRLQAKQSTDLIVALIGQKSGGGDDAAVKVAEAMGAQNTAFLTAIVNMKSGEGSAADKMLDAIQTGVNLANGARDAQAEANENESGIGEIGETLKTVAEVASKLGGGSAPPNGTAAAL